MKSIGAAPDEPGFDGEIAYLEESDGFRAVCGTMKIVLGLLVMVSAGLVLMGSQMFGTEGFFRRIWNVIMSARADYYDIRADKPEPCSGMLLLGSDSMRTFPNVRNIPANIKRDDEYRVLVPGCCGSTTFYIVPNTADGDQTFNIKLNAYGLKRFGSCEPVRLSKIECGRDERRTYDAVDELLDGHILFFEGRSGGHHGLLKDGKMHYRTAEHRDALNENGEYAVTVYWVWTEYYDQMINTDIDGALFDNSAEAAAMHNYIEDNKEKYFLRFDEADDLCQQYDNGDRLICQNADYIGFEIIAE